MAMELGYLQRNWPMFVAPIVAGLAIYACKQWSFFVFIGSMISLFFFSYQGYLSKAQSIGIEPVIFIFCINTFVVGYFLFPAVREVYMNPRLRWWEAKPRFRCDFQCQLLAGETTHPGLIGNFSEGGLFLKSEHIPADRSTVEIQFTGPDDKSFSFKGKVIQHDKQTRVGFGLMFIHGRQSLSDARTITRYLDKQGLRMGHREKLADDSFFGWLKTLFKTGSGLLPKKDKSMRS